MQLVHCKKIIAIWALMTAGAALSAQSSNYNYLDFQHKPYYFGVTLGINKSDYAVFRSKDFIGNDSISRVESVRGPGFNLGIVTNLKIGDYFDLRLLPTLSFAERRLEYTPPKSGPVRQRKIGAVFVEVPFQVRFKSEPYHDKRAFVVAGVKYAFDVANESKTRQADELVRVAPTDFSIEGGVGMQFFFPFFIFSPEIKYSHGISNVLLFNSALEQSTVLDKVLSRTFTISFHFEG